MTSSSRGIVYVATGTQYINEALVSIKSLKQHMPEMPVTLFASEEGDYPQNIDVARMDSPNYDYPGIDKIQYISNSPYRETLFLDSDTFVVESFDEVFQLLKEFDLALSHAPVRQPPRKLKGKEWINYDEQSISKAFSELNTGVILFRKSEKTDQFFQDWLTECRKRAKNRGKPLHDQAAFRTSFYPSSLRLATLTPEYNCRFIFPTYVQGRVKILHGRTPNLEASALKVNNSEQPRILIWDGQGIRLLDRTLMIESKRYQGQCEVLQNQVNTLRQEIESYRDNEFIKNNEAQNEEIFAQTTDLRKKLQACNLKKKDLRKKLQACNSERKELRKKLKNIREQNLKIKSNLADAKQLLTTAQSEIKSIKNSKFWSMRSLWIHVKKKLGLTD